jgi:hypothetical protein
MVRELEDALQPEDLELAVKEVLPAQRRLLQGLGYGKAGEPNPYVALLLADGDRMGAALSRLTSEEEHRQFSQRLEENFASRAIGLVESHGGSLLYAGGDDVLALVPVCSVLACSRALHGLFGEAMKEAMPATAEEHPTLSVGVAVAHMLEPFGEIRQMAQRAEKAAKESGRNALAVLYKPRSGIERLVEGSWLGEAAASSDQASPRLPALDERLASWAGWIASGELPMRLPQHIDDELLRLRDVSPRGNSQTSAVDPAMLRALLDRIIDRRRPDRGRSKAVQPGIRDLITQFWDVRSQAGDPWKVLQDLAHEVFIAQAFSDAWKDAWGGANAAPQADAPEAVEAHP